VSVKISQAENFLKFTLIFPFSGIFSLYTFHYNHMFPRPTLQSDTVKYKHLLDKQLFMHWVKKVTCF